MFAKILLILISVFYCFSCANKQQDIQPQNINFVSSQTEDSIKFFEYYSNLNTYNSPLHLFCGLDANTLYKKAPFQNYFSSNPETPLVVGGRIFSNNPFITILYGNVGDDIYPAVFTFNKYGLKIDSLDLAGDCSGEEGYLSSTSVTFKENNYIIKVDSISRFNVNELGEEIEGSDTTTIFNYKFMINNEGNFIRVDSTKKIISIK